MPKPTQDQSARTAVPAAAPSAPPLKKRTWDKKMMRAAESGDERGLREALEAGADPSWEEGRGRTALMRAAVAGRVGCVRVLAARGHVRSRDSFGRDALMLAASEGEVAGVRALLESGECDVDARCGREGWTALALALIEGRVDAAEELLGAGARLDAKDSGGMSVMGGVAAHGDEGKAEALRWICEKGGAGQALLRCPMGRTPLDWSALRGEADCVDILAPVSDLAGVDAEGRTALDVARAAGSSRVAGMLEARMLASSEAKELGSLPDPASRGEAGGAQRL